MYSMQYIELLHDIVLYKFNVVIIVDIVDKNVSDWTNSAVSLQHSAGSRRLAHTLSTLLESAFRAHAGRT